MSKYNMALTVEDNTIPGMIMKRIAQGSDVLEFGPAEGRMTEYLSTELGCHVCIVEIDNEAYKSALRYAEDGFCGDIEEYLWEKHFDGRKFDYILFADVLEHLKNPQKALTRIKDFLKQNGKVILSVPNIAHNDIVTKLYNNNFDYTNIGLLDNTHIHFWGKNNLKDFAAESGYTIEVLDGVYLPPFHTEQYASGGKGNDSLLSALYERNYNDLYQFFLVLCLNDWAQANGIITKDYLKVEGDTNALFCYWDLGNGYTSENYCRLDIKETDSGKVYYCNNIPAGCTKMRFSPTNGTDCAVRNISIIADKTSRCDFYPLNGITLPDGRYIFSRVVPQIEVIIPSGSKIVEIYADIKAYYGYEAESYYSLVTGFSLLNEKNTALKSENDNLIGQKEQLVLKNAELIQHSAQLETGNVNLTQRNEELAIGNAALTQQNAEMASENALLTQQNAELASENAALTQQNAEMVSENASLTQQNAELASGNATLTQQNSELASGNEALTRQNAELASGNAALTQQNVELASGNAALTQQNAELISENDKLFSSNEQYKCNIAELQSQRDYYIALYQQVNAQYVDVSQSQCWKLTWPLRKTLDIIKKSKVGSLAYKFMFNLKHNGIRYSLLKVKGYIRKKESSFEIRDLQSPSEVFYSYIIETSKIYLQDSIKTVFKKKNKRVLLVSHEMHLTGAPIALLHMAEVLREMKYDVIFASPTDGQLSCDAERKGIPVIVNPNVYTMDFLGKIHGVFDCVVANTIVGAPVVSGLGWTDIPVLWWVHEAEVSYTEEFAGRMPEVCPSNVTCVTAGEWAKMRLMMHRPEYTPGVLLYSVPEIKNINDEFPAFLPDCARGKIIIVIVGTIEERKAQDTLVKAALLLSKEELNKCFFVFVGKKYYVPIYERITEFCDSHPQNACYISQLNHADIYTLYKSMTCLVCTSIDDPMPIVVTEAMQLSKFVICSEYTGSAGVIRQYDCGVVYKNNDPSELAEDIRNMIAGRYDLKLYGERGVQAYRENFSDEVFAANISDIFGTLNSASVDETLKFATELKKLAYCNDVISVVIPTYNAGDDFTELMKKLGEQKGVKGVEVVIVDSGSHDNTVKIAEEYNAKVIEIPQSQFSHSYARNLGASKAGGKYVLFMVQDALPSDEYWLSKLVQPLLTGEAVAATCIQIPRPDADLMGALSIYMHSKYMEFDKNRIARRPRDNDFSSIRKNSNLDDVSCLVVKDIFEKFGYRGDYAEDLDLGIRLIKSGHRLAFLSSAQVIHSHNRVPFYYMKRALVDNITLKKVFPDYPFEVVDALCVSDRIAIVTCMLDMCRKELSTCSFNSNQELCDALVCEIDKTIHRINQCTKDEIVDTINNCLLTDENLKNFIVALIKEYGLHEKDYTFVYDIKAIINDSLRSYFIENNVEYTMELLDNVFGMMERRIGQYCGVELAHYALCHASEDDFIMSKIDSYKKGV